MDLWYAPTSPFARKVRVVAHELGVEGRLRLIETNPWTDERLRALNPLAKVPTLVLDDGAVVWESGLIAERLASMASAQDLFPAAGEPRWRALSLQALADGASATAGRLFADENRPPDQRSEAMLARFAATLEAALDRLEEEPFAAQPTIGEVAAAVCLGYLDFRWPGRDWRVGRPRLARWSEMFASRPSMIQTAHRLPLQP